MIRIKVREYLKSAQHQRVIALDRLVGKHTGVTSLSVRDDMLLVSSDMYGTVYAYSIEGSLVTAINILDDEL